jgi:hypothetical protein
MLQFLRGERVIVCVLSDHHQRLNSVDAAELLSEYGCQCVQCDGCTQRVSTFFWTPLYINESLRFSWRYEDDTPCSLEEVYRRFVVKYCLHFQSPRISQASTTQHPSRWCSST